jgi:hypothetical protein
MTHNFYQELPRYRDNIARVSENSKTEDQSRENFSSTLPHIRKNEFSMRNEKEEIDDLEPEEIEEGRGLFSMGKGKSCLKKKIRRLF